jgi:UDP-N-acetyl-D-mannosaminuronate dehydrogenase
MGTFAVAATPFSDVAVVGLGYVGLPLALLYIEGLTQCGIPWLWSR